MYKFRNVAGPYYRKFLVGDLGVEINEDGKGGLWFHLWNCTLGPLGQRSGTFHFDSEEQLREFCNKILG